MKIQFEYEYDHQWSPEQKELITQFWSLQTKQLKTFLDLLQNNPIVGVERSQEEETQAVDPNVGAERSQEDGLDKLNSQRAVNHPVAPSKEKTLNGVSADDIRRMIMELNAGPETREQVRSVLAEYGATKFSELAQEHYASFAERLVGL